MDGTGKNGNAEHDSLLGGLLPLPLSWLALLVTICSVQATIQVHKDMVAKCLLSGELLFCNIILVATESTASVCSTCE